MNTLNTQTLKLAAMALNNMSTFVNLEPEDITKDLTNFMTSNPDHREIIELQYVSTRLIEILNLLESKFNRPSAEMRTLLAGQAEAMNFYAAYLLARIVYTQRYGS